MTSNRDELRPRAGRTYTKRTTAAVVAFFMLVILISLTPWVNRSVAETALSLSTMAILALLGVYQAVGHLDYRVKKGNPDAGDVVADRE